MSVLLLHASVRLTKLGIPLLNHLLDGNSIFIRVLEHISKIF